MNILLIFLCFFILLFIIIFIIQSTKIRKLSAKPKNKVHFYVARDKNSDIYLYLGKPIRCHSNFVNLYGSLGNFANEYDFKDFGLNPDDFKDLKWEDEPVEVFLNLED